MTAEVAIAEASIGEGETGETFIPVVVELLPEHRPLMIVDTDFHRADYGETFGGESIFVSLERIGIAISGISRGGDFIQSPNLVKILREAWPVIRGEPGTELHFWFGYQPRTSEDEIIWQGPFLYVLGQDVSVQPLIEGVFLGIRITSEGQAPWDLLSLDLDIDPTGEPV